MRHDSVGFARILTALHDTAALQYSAAFCSVHISPFLSIIVTERVEPSSIHNE